MIEQADADHWACVRNRLREEVGEAAFNSWLRPLTLAEVTGERVCLHVPTQFMRDWVQTNYVRLIDSVWGGGGRTERVHVSVALVQRPPPNDGESSSAHPSAPEVPDVGSRFTFENFVVGKPNELAYNTARRVAESAIVTYNPLYFAGGVGLGKTHLMHAIAAAIRARHRDRNIVYLSAERFMFEFIQALRFQDAISFKEKFRSVDVLMIDDVQFFEGKESTQEELFHTFNSLVDRDRQVVISGDRSPSKLDRMEERMRSRLGCGLVADIGATDYELRLGILQSKVERMVAAVPQDVLEFLARRVTSNVRDLEGGLHRLVAYSNLVGRPVTLDTTREILQDLLQANDRRVSIGDIQHKVAQHFNLRIGDMHSSCRAREVARPRMVAMYLSRHLTGRSLAEIGRKFGGRDHTTVRHATITIQELRTTDPALNEDVELLLRLLDN